MKKKTILKIVLSIAFVLYMGVAGLLWLSYGTALPHEASLGGAPLSIEYAITEREHEQGLSGRASVPQDTGMLFVFEEEGKHGFWMKDMEVPLDLFWIDSEGNVVSLYTNVSPDTYPRIFYPEKPVRYVLETGKGFADAHSIGIGSLFVLKNPLSVSK